MAIPPINEQEFLKRLGKIATTKTATTVANKTSTNNSNPPKTSGLAALAASTAKSNIQPQPTIAQKRMIFRMFLII